MNAHPAFRLLSEAFRDWRADNAPRLGAALAYYTLFALAPLLVVAIAVAGLAFGREAAQGRIVSELGGLVGLAGARAIEALIESSRKPEAGVLATLLGAGTLLLGASGAFVELKGGLNQVWEVEPPAGGLWGIVRDRLAAFALVLAVGFLLLASLLVSAALSATGTLLARFVSQPAGLLQAGNALVSLAVITVLFALIFKYLPDSEVAWGDVWAGAAMTSVLFTAGKFVIGLYLGHSGVTSAYGAAGSVVVLIVWVYYAAQIFYFGAELTQAYARTHGSRERGTTLAVVGGKDQPVEGPPERREDRADRRRRRKA